MKFIINKMEFLGALSKIQGLTGRKTNLFITETVLIKTEGKSKIKLVATDLETGFEGLYPAAVESEGIIALNSKKLYEIVKEFNNNEIIINEIENRWIEISDKKTQYLIVGMIPDDFPETPQIENVDFFNINSTALRKMIDKSIIITGASDEKRAHINGIYFERLDNDDKKTVKIVSTDGNRLSVADHFYSKDFNLPPGPGVIIPKKGLNEVSKFLDVEEDVQIGVKENHFIIKKNKETITIRLLEGNFPKYDDIIEQNDGNIIKINRKEFLNMLKRMSILSSEKYKGLLFNFDENKLLLTKTNPEIGESKEDTVIEFKGEPIEVAFNVRYFIETLNIIDDETIIINIINEEKPCFIKGEKDNSYLSVIMPMRI